MEMTKAHSQHKQSLGCRKLAQTPYENSNAAIYYVLAMTRVLGTSSCLDSGGYNKMEQRISKDVVHVCQHFGNRWSAKASGHEVWPFGLVPNPCVIWTSFWVSA